LAGLLVALDRAPALALGAELVSVGRPGPQPRGPRHLRRRAVRGETTRALRGTCHRPSGALLRLSRDCLGTRLFPVGDTLPAMAMARARPVPDPAEPCATIRRLLHRRARDRSLRHGSWLARIGGGIGAALGGLARWRGRDFHHVARPRRVDHEGIRCGGSGVSPPPPGRAPSPLPPAPASRGLPSPCASPRNGGAFSPASQTMRMAFICFTTCL